MGSGNTTSHGDVVRPLLPTLDDGQQTRSAVTARPITRWLAHVAFSNPLNLPTPATGLDGGHVALPATPEYHGLDDPFDSELERQGCHDSKYRLSRRRRNAVIIWLSGIVSLLVWAYAWDVDSSWKAVEDQWASHLSAHGNMTHETGVTKLWGHSHNDEMHHDDAFTLALGLGLGSIEVDTYLVDQKDGSRQLMVGHEAHDLDGRTLQSVYLDPIYDILEKHNQHRKSKENWVGLLADDPHAEVQLVIDFKSDGVDMWPYMLEALHPLREAGYLTTYSRKTESFTRGPLTVIGTGNTPLSHVYYASERVIFYDAPLRRLHKPARIPDTEVGPAIEIQLDATVAPMASSKFPTLAHVGVAMHPLRNPVIKWMARSTDEARRRGIKSRWWGAAAKPKWVRRRVWSMMKEARTDWINGDDLRDLAHWLRKLDNRI